MNHYLWRGLLLFVVSLAMPALTNPRSLAPQSIYLEDPRLEHLRRYLEKRDAPIAPLAEEFLVHADRNGLDWRLLPGIAVIESSAGVNYRNNNIFGWANGDHRFASVRHGLHLVAQRLGGSPIYRNRSTEAKLRLYNPRPEYAGAVLSVMRQIGPRIVTRQPVRMARNRAYYSNN